MLILQQTEVVEVPHSLTKVSLIHDITFISFISMSRAYLVKEFQVFHIAIKYSLSGFLSPVLWAQSI